MNFRLTFLFLSLVLLFSCGGDDESTDTDQLIGKYVLESFSAVNCDDPDFNQSLEAGPNGACETVDDEEICVAICFTFSETTFSYTFESLVNGAILFDFSDSVPYDPNVGDFTFCPPGSDCVEDDVTISSDNNTITLTGTDVDNCEFVLVLKRS